jgi:hypothetical protein
MTTPRSAGYCSARQQYLAKHLHRCGPRAVLEALLSVAHGADLDTTLIDYARLPASVFHAVGADVLPIDEVRLISGGRR